MSMSARGLVVTSHPPAVRAGLEMLEADGAAVDPRRDGYVGRR